MASSQVRAECRVGQLGLAHSVQQFGWKCSRYSSIKARCLRILETLQANKAATSSSVGTMP